MLFCLISALLSCSKEASTTNTSSTPTNPSNPTVPIAKNIYVSGMDISGQNFVATYWKNGSRTQLSNSFSYTNDIFVSGSNVYIVGFEGSPTHYPILWKNGTKTQLSSNPGYATSVFVSGSDVYVCGTEYLSTTNSGQTVAFLWKNGVKTRYGNNSGASCVFINGYDVFVAGYTLRNSNTAATYWQNGVEPLFLPVTRSTAKSICVAGSELYMIGRDNVTNLPALWRRTFGGVSNGHAQTQLSTNTKSIVNSIAVSGSNTFIAGEENGACYWKNGVRTQLSSNSETTADKVFLFASDFYIAGRGGNDLKAGYWKNGTRVDLPSNIGSYATSIFVD